MIDTNTKNIDIEMEEEKGEKNLNRENLTEKSETNEIDKSDVLSNTFEINPFLNKTVSVDVLKELNPRQRLGRSESIHNPILNDFWVSINGKGQNWKKIKPDDNYFKLEERGYMRHLLLEGNYDQALLHLKESFPEVIEKEEVITVAIYCLQFGCLLKDGKIKECVAFVKEKLNNKEQFTFPALDDKGEYLSVSIVDYFSLIAYDNLDEIKGSYLLKDCQREVISDYINDLIVSHLGGKEHSKLENHMKHLNYSQLLAKQQRNGIGEIFQFKVPK